MGRSSLNLCIENSVSESGSRLVSMTGWWAPSFDLFRPHHPVPSNRVFSRPGSHGPFVPAFPLSISDPFWSLRPFVVSGGDFAGRVSASKNPVPGGQGQRPPLSQLSTTMNRPAKQKPVRARAKTQAVGSITVCAPRDSGQAIWSGHYGVRSRQLQM